MDVEQTVDHIANVPCLHVKPNRQVKGTILLYHGWSSTMHSYSFFATLFADWGYRVIVPELPHHGERGQLAYGDRGELQKYFWEVVLQADAEADQIVTQLLDTEEREAMNHPLIVIGHSTGGFIGAGLLTKNRAVQSAIVINGSCAWVKCEELLREKFGIDAMDLERSQQLQAIDPVSQLSLDDGRSLLLLHGDADDTVPIESQRFFMTKMSQNNRNAASIRLIEYPNVNHHITLQMLEASKEWLEQVQSVSVR